MSALKRLREIVVKVQEEKEQALADLEKEYLAKRRKIEEEYDLKTFFKKDFCNLCDGLKSWKCSECSYILCKDCTNGIVEARKTLLKSRLRILKLGPLPIAEAKKQFMEEGLKCPHCRVTKITVK